MSLRECGPCTLCCKVLAVPELDKPAGVWCRHARKGGGCDRYATRPPTCQAFICGWQQGLIREVLRPDRVHAVVSAQVTDGHLAIFEDAGFPGEARTALAPEIAAACEAGRLAVVVRGHTRTVIGTTSALARVADSV